MARANLDALLADKTSPANDRPEMAATSTAPVASVGEGRPDGPPAVADVGGYLRLARKETRVRDDQYAELTAQARRLNRAKTESGERITENTLIRIGIDWVLSQAGALHGNSEVELRKSVGL